MIRFLVKSRDKKFLFCHLWAAQMHYVLKLCMIYQYFLVKSLFSNKKSPVFQPRYRLGGPFKCSAREPFSGILFWIQWFDKKIFMYLFIFNCILKKFTCMYFSLDTDSEDYSSAAHGSPSAESFDAKSYGNISPNRSFNNYVDMILTFFDYIPTSKWKFFTWTWTKIGFFWPPTHLILST